MMESEIIEAHISFKNNKVQFVAVLVKDGDSYIGLQADTIPTMGYYHLDNAIIEENTVLRKVAGYGRKMTETAKNKLFKKM